VDFRLLLSNSHKDGFIWASRLPEACESQLLTAYLPFTDGGRVEINLSSPQNTICRDEVALKGHSRGDGPSGNHPKSWYINRLKICPTIRLRTEGPSRSRNDRFEHRCTPAIDKGRFPVQAQLILSWVKDSSITPSALGLSSDEHTDFSGSVWTVLCFASFLMCARINLA